MPGQAGTGQQAEAVACLLGRELSWARLAAFNLPWQHLPAGLSQWRKAGLEVIRALALCCSGTVGFNYRGCLAQHSLGAAGGSSAWQQPEAWLQSSGHS